MPTSTSSRPRTLSRLEHWPLFSIELQLSEGAVWAYVSGLPSLQGRPDGWKHLVDEWHRLERACWQDGIRGWYCVCAFNNKKMQRWLTAIQAEPYGHIPARGFMFQKEITQDPTAFHEGNRVLVTRLREWRHACLSV